ncbi:MAG: uroporphyrinogen-III C-methyltransferase [Candidatus Symbiodolus clandestinus]
MSTDNQEPPKSKSAPPPRRAMRFFWLRHWISYTIVLVLLGGSGWFHWQSYRCQQQQQALLQALSSHLSTYQHQVQRQLAEVDRQQYTFQKQLGRQTEQLLQSQQHLAQQAEQLSVMRRQLVDLSATRRQDWQLIEAQRLINAAGYQLWLLHDVMAAHRLLQGAADLLAMLEQPALLTVRQALAEECRQLASMTRPNQEALILQLLNLQDQVQKLPIKKPPLPTVDSMSNQLETSSGWRRLLAQGQRLLQSLITIQQHSESIAIPISWHQNSARERLSIYLRMAVQNALYRQDTGYQQAISHSIDYLLENFEPSETAVSHLAAQLRLLQQPLLPVDLPQQLPSQILLEAFLQHWAGEVKPLLVRQSEGSY